MRRTWIAAAGGVFAGMIAIALAVQDRSDDHRTAEPGGIGLPHCGGIETTIDEVLSSAPYSFSLSLETSIAEERSLKGIWKCPGSATLLEFSSGVTITLTVNTITDPDASWRGVAKSNPEVYSVGTVQGVSALLIDPEADATHTAEGGLTFVLDGIEVNVGGNGVIPLSELTSVAENLRVSSASS